MNNKRFWTIGGVLLALPLSVCLYVGILVLAGNFHSVVAGELYRSAQPSSEQLGRYVRDYGIRTVINLRGANDAASWYQAEIAESHHLGIDHKDFRMSSRAELSQGEAAALIDLFQTSRKPILIHCADGSDRTGLASALYLAAVAKQGEKAAESQISIRYGHLAIALSPTWPTDMSFEDLEPWLGFHDS
jgi:protein tyrosine/serine phosphatase